MSDKETPDNMEVPSVAETESLAPPQPEHLVPAPNAGAVEPASATASATAPAQDGNSYPAADDQGADTRLQVRVRSFVSTMCYSGDTTTSLLLYCRTVTMFAFG